MTSNHAMHHLYLGVRDVEQDSGGAVGDAAAGRLAARASRGRGIGGKRREARCMMDPSTR